MAEFIEPNEAFFTSWEPKLQNRFLFQIDGIPSYMIKKAARPNSESAIVEIPHINIMRYSKGKTKWGGTVDLELFDPIAPSGAAIMMEWYRAHHESITGRDGFFDMYAKDCSVVVLDPVLSIVESWTYKGCFIKSIDFGGLDWSTEADPTNITLSLQYQYPILNF